MCLSDAYNANHIFVAVFKGCTMEERFQHGKKLCLQGKYHELIYPSGNKIIVRNPIANLYMFERFKILYCQLGKTGTNSIFKMLIDATEMNISTANPHDPSALAAAGIVKLRDEDLTNEELVNRLHTYFKFAVVRNPMTRLVSAYNNKFVDYYYESAAEAIFSITRNGNYTIGDRPSWKEFINYIPIADQRDGHWVSQFDACRPCDIQYDAIIKMEYLDDEVSALRPVLGDKSHIAHRNPSSVVEEGGNRRHRTYADYINDLSDEEILKMKRHYERDFGYFGYDISVEDRKLSLNEECAPQRYLLYRPSPSHRV